MKLKLSLCLSMAALSLLPALAPAQVPEGQPAPKVSMKLLKDGVVSDFPGWEAYKGKVVVVELWGTWCPPCVAAIPHMNALQKALQEKPVEFISITEESADTIRKFQTRHPMSGTVGVGGGSAIRLLGAGGFPQTVIISKTGTVLRYTQPEELSEKTLGQLLYTGSSSAIKRILLEKNPRKTAVKEPLLEVRVDSVPYDSENSYGHTGGDTAVTLNFTGDLRFMLSQAYEISEKNIEISSGLPQQKFSFFMRVPRVSENVMLTQVIKTAYGAEVRSVSKEKRVLLLQYNKDTPHSGLVPSKSGGSSKWGNGFIHVEGATMEDLLGLFEGVYGMPVVDETGLTGSYKINLEWTPGDKDSLAAIIKDQLGITFAPASRSIDVLKAFPVGDGGGE